MFRGEERERADDQRNARDMIDRTQIVQLCHGPDADVVQNRLRQEQHGKDDHIALWRIRHMQQGREESRTTIINARDGGDEPDKIQPAGQPAPARPAQQGGPVVERAGGGNGRGQFRHRSGHEQHENGHERPADAHDDRAARL